MNKVRLAVAAVLLLVGLVWIAQGTGTVAGSAMSGQSMWALVGGVFVVAGLALGLREFIRRPSGRP
jgi:O-antigen/teichoic acid export membrane protein